VEEHCLVSCDFRQKRCSNATPTSCSSH